MIKIDTNPNAHSLKLHHLKLLNDMYWSVGNFANIQLVIEFRSVYVRLFDILIPT
jgi:hypothetical protein